MSKTIKTIVLFSFSKIVIRKVLFSSVNKNLLARFSTKKTVSYMVFTKRAKLILVIRDVHVKVM